MLLLALAVSGASIHRLPIHTLGMSADGRVFVGATAAQGGEPATWTVDGGIRRVGAPGTKGYAHEVSAEGSVVLFWRERPTPRWLYAQRGNAARPVSKALFPDNRRDAVRLTASGALVLTTVGKGLADVYRKVVRVDRVVALRCPVGLSVPYVEMSKAGNRFFGSVLYGASAGGVLRNRAAVWGPKGDLTFLAPASPTQSSMATAANEDGSLIAGSVGDTLVVWPRRGRPVRFSAPRGSGTSEITAVKDLSAPIYGSSITDADTPRAWVRLPNGRVVWLSTFLEGRGIPTKDRGYHQVLAVSRNGKVLLVAGHEGSPEPVQWRVILP